MSLASDVQNFLVNKYFSLSVIVKSILFMPIVALFFVFCVHRLYQKLFGRKKNHYDELLYLIVGSYVPFVLVSIFIALIPGVGKILFRITMNYPLILVVIAVKAITKLKVWQSIVVVGLGALLAMAGSLMIPLFITSILHTTSVMF